MSLLEIVTPLVSYLSLNSLVTLSVTSTELLNSLSGGCIFSLLKHNYSLPQCHTLPELITECDKRVTDVGRSVTMLGVPKCILRVIEGDYIDAFSQLISHIDVTRCEYTLKCLSYSLMCNSLKVAQYIAENILLSLSDDLENNYTYEVLCVIDETLRLSDLQTVQLIIESLYGDPPRVSGRAYGIYKPMRNCYALSVIRDDDRVYKYMRKYLADDRVYKYMRKYLADVSTHDVWSFVDVDVPEYTRWLLENDKIRDITGVSMEKSLFDKKCIQYLLGRITYEELISDNMTVRQTKAHKLCEYILSH